MGIIGSIISAILMPFLYPLLIMAPLWILDSVYRVFRLCCGQNLAELFFHSTGIGDINWSFQNNQIIRVMLIALVIGVVVSALMFAIAGGIQYARHRPMSEIKSKIKWPIIGVISFFALPIGFTLISTLSSVLMQVLGGAEINNYIDANLANSLLTNLQSKIDALASCTGITINWNVGSGAPVAIESMDKNIDIILQMLGQISADAQAKGFSNIVENCQNLIKEATEIKGILANLSTDITNLQDALQKGLTNIGKDGTVIPNQDYANTITAIKNKFDLLGIYWSDITSNLVAIHKQYANIIANESLITIGDNDYKIWDIVRYNLENDNVFKDFDNYWVGDKSQWNIILTNVCQYKDVNYGLNRAMSGIDPQAVTSFSLTVLIYQMVTGNNDSNWASFNWSMHGSISLINVGIGFVCIVCTVIVVALFSIWAARRIIELVICMVFTVFNAFVGVTDDGIKYNMGLKTFIGKMFAIVIAWWCFSIGITVIKLVVDGFAKLPSNPLAGIGGMLVQVFLYVGGMLGAYHFANWLTNQYGDNNSLSSTMADLGIVKTGVMLGIGAGAVLGKHTVQPSAQKVSALHNKKLQAKFGTHESNVANYAEKLGLGRKTTTFVNGKEQTVFNLDPELKGAADIYNKMMQDSKTFSTKSRARASLMDKMGMTTLSGETHQSKIDKQLGKYASEVEKLKSKGK